MTRSSPAGLGCRLDSEHYSPDAVSLDEALIKLGNARALRLIVNPSRKITNGVRGPDLRPSEFKLVRLQDCRDWQVVFDDCVTISAEQFKDNRRCRLEPDDVVVAIGGYLGNAAVVSESAKAVIGQHSALLPFGHTTKDDPRYVTAYLNSAYGAIQFSRWSRGTVQAGLNLEDIGDIAIPCPASDAQAYVGDKVRQAETLRALARGLIDEAHGYFGALHLRTTDGWRGAWRRNPVALEEGRLDAWFYAPAPTELDIRLREEGGRELRSHAKLVTQNSFDASRPILYFEIGNLELATGCAWPAVVQPDAIPSRAQRSLRPWDILVSTVRPERKNVALIGPDFTGQLVASSGFSVLRAPSAEEAAFLCWFLRSDAGTDQLLRWNTGAAYPAIDDDVPLRVLMPEFEATEIRRLGSRWMQIPSLFLFARTLTGAARSLVEALIERKVTETELIAAHKDPAADRALLQRLTTQGLDATDGDRLFPDLDRLEELLANTKAEKNA